MMTSAGIVLVLGLIHLAYTFRGPLLTPRDPALQAMMSNVSPVLTRQTTMWKAWLRFNAILLTSVYLLLVGLVMICGYVVLARLYWFSVPFWSTSAALVCYLAGIGVSRA